jgi:XRE family transcriptional regulator, regulator of sulfur utilization
VTKKHLGQHVRALRDAKGLTQEALAECSGLHRVYLAQLEAGRNQNPRLDTLRRLAKALGVSVADLVAE